MRVTTETFDEAGRPAGSTVTETRITVVAVDDGHVTLQSEVAVMVGDKKFAPQPQVIKQSLAGDIDAQTTQIRLLGEEIVQVDGEKVPAEVRQMVLESGGQRRTRTLHLCRFRSPAVLREATVATDLSGQTVSYQTDVEVVALDMPFRWQDHFLPVAHRKVTHTHAGGATTTVELWSDDIPGGVVSHTSKEVDPQGRLLRRSTLELVDYRAEEPTTPVQRVSRLRLFRRGME